MGIKDRPADAANLFPGAELTQLGSQGHSRLELLGIPDGIQDPVELAIDVVRVTIDIIERITCHSQR